MEMAQITNHIENFKMNINEDFVRKAQELEPDLHYKTVRPAQLVSFQPSDAPDKPDGWDLPSITGQTRSLTGFPAV